MRYSDGRNILTGQNPDHHDISYFLTWTLWYGANPKSEIAMSVTKCNTEKQMCTAKMQNI